MDAPPAQPLASASSEPRETGTLERAAKALATGAAPSKRALVIVNPYATTVSDRLRNLVVYALQARYEVEAVDTEDRGHATELCREAAHEGYDVVVAFGGDGTVNEAANGLLGSDTPLTCLPGGSTNAYCKILGIPGEIVDATEHLLRIADSWRPRRVDLASVNGRHYLFSAGVGLDASVVRRVDAHPRRKVRYGAWYFASVGVETFLREYLVRPPRMRVEVDAGTFSGVEAIVQNAAPYTYFNERPIDVAEQPTLDDGTLAGVVLRRASVIDMPTLIWRVFSRRARVARHRQVDAFADARELRVYSADDRRLPLHVDGDFIGEVDEARFAVAPRRLTVVC